MHSTSTISSTSQSSISTSLCRWITTIASILHFRRGRGRSSSKAISRIFSVPWPVLLAALITSVSIYPSSQRPGRRAGIISELAMACTDSHVSPSFPRTSEMFPSVLSSPAPNPPSKCTPPAPAHLAHPRSCTPRPSPHLHRHRHSASWCLHHIHSSRAAHGSPDSRRTGPSLARLGAYPALPAARSRPRLEALQRRRATRSLSYARAVHLAALVTPRAYPPAHGPFFVHALALALDSMRALSALTLPAFNAELSAAPARARRTHLALPHFVGVPPVAHDVPPAPCGARQ
ncbi:hypothetical protein EDB85DRAFT_404043 [Lactarius pseudohatsudake]|nr:hypothetical protein EDB85DRAFT_404043 [Lactarius pseudohatsudake]